MTYPELDPIRRLLGDGLAAAGYETDPSPPKDDWGAEGLAWIRRVGGHTHRIVVLHGYHRDEIELFDALEGTRAALGPGLVVDCKRVEWQELLVERVEAILKAADAVLGVQGAAPPQP